MRCSNLAGSAAGVVAAIVVLAGCGTSTGTLLTPAAATQLTSELTQASSALTAYNCLPAETALTNFSDDVGQLTGVNATLVRMLSEDASRISTLASQRCPTGSSAERTTTAASTTASNAATTTTQSVTSTSVTSTSPVSSTSSQTTTGTGGAAPTTASTPTIATPPATSTPTPATTPDSGGAGLDSSGGASATTGAGAP